MLVLEDVHWSDYSTLDLLGVVARRREPARLLVLCSLRPAEAIMRGHPVATVKRELQRTRLCREILLGGLSATDIASYLAARFPGADLPEDLLPLLVDRSEGNPFFMVALVDHLVEQRLLAKSGSRWELRGDLEALRTAIPDGLRAVVEPRLERLAPEELRVLEAASVAGLEFAAHTIAGVAPHSGDVVYVERLCDTLVRRQEILRAAGESAWPDATSSARYVFRHALYQQVIHQRLSASTRRRLHETIGKRLEAAHGERTAEVAGQLAAHFERSGDIDRAVRYHGEAAALASSRFAYQETRLHLEAALDLGHQQPETPERLRREMVFLQDLGATLFAIKGYGDEGGARAFARMRELAERLDGALTRFNAMQGQLIVHTMRAELATARALGEEMLVLAERLGKPVEVANTHVVLSATLFNLGEMEAARHHAERGRALLDPDAPPLPTDVTIPSAILVASTCGYLGLVARARAMNREALASATTPFHRALATNLASQVCMLLDDVPGARSLAEEAVHLAREYDLAVFGLTATMVRGWCDVEEGRVEDARAAVQAAFHEYGATGQRFGTTCFSLLLARAHLAAGDAVSAHQAVDAALVFAAETGERVYEPELHRLQGECFRASAATRGQKARATECFERALAIAADRKGLLFELRAATSLFRHRGTAARERLVRLVDRFAAEDDCADLHAARALLGPTEPTPSDRRTRRFPQLA